MTFTVDTPPSISVLSPQNQTYNSTDIPLNFTVDQPVTQIRYSLDGRKNVTITGNSTLNRVPEGEHNLTVYAKDDTGNIGASDILYFSVKTPELFPTAYSMGIVAAIVLVLIRPIVYILKRKQ